MAPYAYENMRATGYTCWSNHRWSAAFRAYGAPQTYWGGETAIDMLANKCGIDPFDFREMNLSNGRRSRKIRADSSRRATRRKSSRFPK